VFHDEDEEVTEVPRMMHVQVNEVCTAHSTQHSTSHVRVVGYDVRVVFFD
jgi:hypothetical protein